MAIEATDVVFAVDSIPAIFAVTSDPFIVYTSNIFAILGLRSLYFLLGGVLEKLRYLKVALAGILVFVGAKVLLVDVVKGLSASLSAWSPACSRSRSSAPWRSALASNGRSCPSPRPDAAFPLPEWRHDGWPGS